MADNNRLRGWLCMVAVASAAFMAVSTAIAAMASAAATRWEVTADAARTIDLKTAPEVAPVPLPAGLAINRPTIPMADYLAAKNAAAAAKAPGQAKPGPAAPPTSSDGTLYAQVGSTNETQTTGGNQLPPSGDIATSQQWMVQVNNDVIVMYNWFTNAFVSKNLATFFQYAAFTFDPRVIYDPYWDRFVVLAANCRYCNTANNLPFLDMAVSKTGDPSGEWFTLLPNQPFQPGDFYDFPQLGMDLNSIIVTYNYFPLGGGFDARTFSVAKALLYNGRDFSASAFGGSGCTMAPPYVLDTSGVDYLMAFCPGDNKVWIASLSNSGLANASLHLWDNTVSVANHGIPPQAVQPAPNGAYTLDTGDNRFENRSLQVGSRILNTATVNLSGYPGPAYYNFNIGVSPHTLVSEGTYFASSSSYDWHPAINANTLFPPAGTPLGGIFTTWMSTDPVAGTNVQLRAGGWIGDSGFTYGIPIFTSPFGLTNQTDSNGVHRTGDYAYIATYPAAALGCLYPGELGILEGETVGPAAGTWGTHVAIVKHC